jgi:hypothetical protein
LRIVISFHCFIELDLSKIYKKMNECLAVKQDKLLLGTLK